MRGEWSSQNARSDAGSTCRARDRWATAIAALSATVSRPASCRGTGNPCPVLDALVGTPVDPVLRDTAKDRRSFVLRLDTEAAPVGNSEAPVQWRKGAPIATTVMGIALAVIGLLK